MEDFNHIEHDPIPEGLEFNESYMQDAFALYDTEKNKRKRRLIIWWITSALGFASILLIGITAFSKREPSTYPVKKEVSDKKTVAQNLPADPASGVTYHSSSGKAKNTEGKTPEIKGSVQIQAKNASTIKSSPNEKWNSSKAKVTANLKPGRIAQKRQNREITRDISETKDPNQIQDEHMSVESNSNSVTLPGPGETAKTDSIFDLEPLDLTLKPALLVCADDSTLALPANYPLQPESPVLRKHQVFLNLGVNTLFGIKELKNRITFRESIGVSYAYQITPKITIGTGLEYHSISRISYKRIIGDTTNSDNTTTILNKTTLNYISFLPQIHYQLWPNHKITAGFGIEYLLTDPSERYEIENYTQENQKRTNSKLYYSTFNRFNFSVSLGYVYQFSRFMSIQASYHYGFTDITKNNNFNQTFDRNSRLQLGLKIKLY